MIPPRTILAATDFSDASLGALAFAARLARHCEAALHIVHAEHPLLSAAARQSGVDLASGTPEWTPPRPGGVDLAGTGPIGEAILTRRATTTD